MQRLLVPVLSLILLAYPFTVYFGLHYWEPKSIGLLLLILLLLRFALTFFAKRRTRIPAALLLLTIVSVVLSLAVWIFNHVAWIRFNPVAINLVLLGLFAYTLWHPPSMIERFARIMTPDLPPRAILYTRRVTIVWCGFFAVNGLVAFYTCFYTSLEIWTLYNGLIAYLLMGLLFVAEYLYRRLFLKVRV